MHWTLADLVGDGTDDLLNHMATKRRWFAAAAAVRPVDELLPWEEINRLLSSGAVPADAMSILSGGHNVDSHLYRDRKSARIKPDVFQDLIGQGASLLINDVHEHVPALGRLAASLERDLEHWISINCYLSFGKASAFKPHFDSHDVLVAQVHGAKRWRGYGVGVPLALTGRVVDVTASPADWDILLQPGDILYLPRDEIHVAQPEQSPAVHITIGIQEATGVGFLRWLSRKAEAIEVLRKGLRQDRDPTGSLTHEAAAKRALHQLIDETPVEDFLANDANRRALRRVWSLGAAESLGPGAVLTSALRRRLDLKASDPREQAIVIGGVPIRLSMLERQILHEATARDGMTLAEVARALAYDPEDPAFRKAAISLARQALLELSAPRSHR